MSACNSPNAAPRPPELLLRAALAYALVLALGWHYGRDLVECLLPAFRAVFLALDDHYRILSLALGSEGADTALRLRVTLARPLLFGARIIWPDPRGWADASTAVGHLLLPATIALGAVLAWPVRGIREALWRLTIALALLTPVLLLDTPIILHAGIWGLLVEANDPQRISPLLLLETFLQGGGRAALGIAIAAFAILVARGDPEARGA